MAKRKKYKPDSARQWRGKSYKKGGKRVRDLREIEVRFLPEIK